MKMQSTKSENRIAAIDEKGRWPRVKRYFWRDCLRVSRDVGEKFVQLFGAFGIMVTEGNTCVTEGNKCR